MRQLIMVALVTPVMTLFAAAPPVNFKPGPATAIASVVIDAPAQLSLMDDLNFGAVRLKNLNRPAVVAMDPAARTVATGVVYKSLRNLTVQAGGSNGVAQFGMWRDANLSVTINASRSVSLTNPQGRSVQFSPVLGTVSKGSTGAYTPVAGTVFEHFKVGGAIQIPAGTVGSFSGPFTVTANYN